MEGLIPYIYRAIKRQRARKYHRSLSTGPSQWFGLPSTQYSLLRPPPIQLGSLGDEQQHAAGHHHRRHRSLEDFSSRELFSPERVGSGGGGGRLAKEMSARFGSGRGRSMFSCVTGAN